MTAAPAMACIGDAVSWLRLEQLALGADDPLATAHLAQCAACRRCMDEIRGDLVALPALPADLLSRGERRARWAWLRWATPMLGVAAAAAIALLVIWPRRGGELGADRDRRVATIKGTGEVALDLVRERDGAIAFGAGDFRAGDRWKLVVTCAPGSATWIDVAVIEAGAGAGASAPAYPLAPARIACGNRVAMPGAFTLTGARANRVCAVLAADAAPARGELDTGAPTVACATVQPQAP